MKANVQTFRLSLVEDRTVSYEVSQADNQVEAYQVIKSYLHDADCEHCVVLMLNGRNKTIGIHTVAIGTIDRTLVGVRDVFKAAIVANASKIIVAHNHPSGDIHPSPDDVDLTHKLSLVGAIMGLPLVDSIITNRDGWVYSFASEGNLYEDEALNKSPARAHR